MSAKTHLSLRWSALLEGLVLLYATSRVLDHRGKSVWRGVFAAGQMFSQSIGQIHQVLWISVVLCGLVPVFVLLAWALGALEKRLRGPGRET